MATEEKQKFKVLGLTSTWWLAIVGVVVLVVLWFGLHAMRSRPRVQQAIVPLATLRKEQKEHDRAVAAPKQKTANTEIDSYLATLAAPNVVSHTNASAAATAVTPFKVAPRATTAPSTSSVSVPRTAASTVATQASATAASVLAHAKPATQIAEGSSPSATTESPAVPALIRKQKQAMTLLNHTIQVQEMDMNRFKERAADEAAKAREADRLREDNAKLGRELEDERVLLAKTQAELAKRPVLPGWTVAAVAQGIAVLDGPNGATKLVHDGESIFGVKVLSIDVTNGVVRTDAGVLGEKRP